MLSGMSTTYNYIISSLGLTDRLEIATLARNVNKVRELLASGILADTIYNNRGETSLHIAAQMGYTEIGDVLLKNGANPESTNKLHQTPMYFAITSGSVGFVRHLVTLKNDLAQAPCGGIKSPLDIAVKTGSMEIVNLLENFGVVISQEIIDRTNMVSWCKTHGYDFNKYLSDGSSYCNDELIDFDYALWDFVNLGANDVVKELLKFDCYKKLLNTKRFDLSFHHNNLKTNSPDVYKKLENNSHDYGNVSGYYHVANTNKGTVIFQAILNNDVEMTRVLMQYGADTDTMVNDLTLSDIVKLLGNSEIISLVCEKQENSNDRLACKKGTRDKR